MDASPLLRVLFVCRGSTRDGLGHVMRCRTVAAEMARRNSVRIAVVGDNYVDGLLAARGLNYRVHDREEDVLEGYESFRPHVVVFDALQFSPQLVERLKQRSLTVSLSPVFNCLARVDMVFHRTVYHGADWRFAEGEFPELRCGLQYSVVRESPGPIPEGVYRQTLEQQPLSIVISMGGADAENKTLQVLRAIQSVSCPLLIWALLGEGYAHSYEALVDCVKQSTRHEIILAKTSDSMWRVMRTCSLAVLAGGTITYEAAYAGLPSINVFENEDHLFLVRELVEKGVCISAGYPMQDALDVVRANLIHLERNRGELLAMHLGARGLIDGRACARIDQEIGQYYWNEHLGQHPQRRPDSPASHAEQTHALARAG